MSNLVKFFEFVVPVDAMRILFLVLIISIALFDAIALSVFAKPKYWKRLWDNGTSTEDDDLDVEHGSIHDLAMAVATKPEKWAEILPGILLIIGLLGTFLGIGHAIQEAAVVLDTNGSTDFHGVLDGLGVKFATSIYGIVGFLVFKSWHSIWGRESERLRWCIEQTKPVIRKRNEDVIAIEQRRHKEHMQVSKAMSQIIQEGNLMLAQQISGIQSSAHEMAESARLVKSAAETLNYGVSQFSPMVQSALENIQTVFVGEMKKSGEVVSVSISTSADKINLAVDNMAQQTHDGHIKFSESIVQLKDLIKNSSDRMDVMAGELKKASQGLQDSSKTSADAMIAVSEKIASTMNVVKAEICEATSKLDETAISNRLAMEDVRDSIKNDLSNISGGNIKMAAAVKALTDSLNVNANGLR